MTLNGVTLPKKFATFTADSPLLLSDTASSNPLLIPSAMDLASIVTPEPHTRVMFVHNHDRALGTNA